MNPQGQTWWRVFAGIFILKFTTHPPILDQITHTLVPCHEDWAWSYQPPYVNDNEGV